ncbi:16765_t:CDS:2, partial [Cetraspora pellucida]
VLLLWANPLKRVCRDSFKKKKIVDIYLPYLNEGEQNELDKLLSENVKIRERYKNQKPTLFSYASYEKNADISQIIRKAFQELKGLHVIKQSYIKEDCLRRGYEQIPRKSLSRPFIMSFAGFQTLYKLSLYNIIFTENDLKNLASLSNLKFLTIEHTSFKEENKEIIGKYFLPKLQGFELKENITGRSTTPSLISSTFAIRKENVIKNKANLHINDERVHECERISWNEFWTLSETPETRLMHMQIYDFMDKKPELKGDIWFRDFVPEFKVIPPKELPSEKKSIFLILMNHFFDDDDINVVINCTRVNARTFGGVMDTTVFSSRGQTVSV